MSEQQQTFYCQELGTLLMCLIHIFKSGRCTALAWLERLCPALPTHPACRCAQSQLCCALCVFDDAVLCERESEGLCCVKDSGSQDVLLPLCMIVNLKSHCTRESERDHKVPAL